LKVQLNIYLTSAQDGGEWSASSPGSLIFKEKAARTHCNGTGWASEPVWALWKKNPFSTRDRTPIIKPAA
jgi:hypothetical protein